MVVYSPEVAALVERFCGPDVDAADVAEAELERLSALGNADAQMAGLMLAYSLWRIASEPWNGFVERVAIAFDRAATSGTVREMFRFSGDEGKAREAHALFLAILDGLADEGDESALAAIGALGDFLPAETQRQARAVRASWEAPPPLIFTNLAPVPPFSRWERLRWWLEDRALDVRLWWWSLCDWISAKLERVRP